MFAGLAKAEARGEGGRREPGVDAARHAAGGVAARARARLLDGAAARAAAAARAQQRCV